MTAFWVRRASAIATALMLTLGSANAQDLKIGVVNPYSGGMALYGDEMTRGYDIAIDEANAKGGVLGRKIVIVRASATNA